MKSTREPSTYVAIVDRVRAKARELALGVGKVGRGHGETRLERHLSDLAEITIGDEPGVLKRSVDQQLACGPVNIKKQQRRTKKKVSYGFET